MLRNIKLQPYLPSTEQRYDRIEIVPYLPDSKRGFKPKAPLYEIVNAILYKLKTGVQWEYLPVESLFSKEVLHYKMVFGHYRKWCELDVWKSCWIELLKIYKSKLDLSSGDLDGSHTTALRGGRGVSRSKETQDYQCLDRQLSFFIEQIRHNNNQLEGI